MKVWTLDRVSGATPEVRDHCRQLYSLFTRATEPEYFMVGPRGGRTAGTYKRFHNAVKAFSKQHPEDAITLQYTIKNRKDDPGEIRTTYYKNGMAVVIGAETKA